MTTDNIDRKAITLDEFTLVMAALAQGVINIDAGITTIEKDSRVYSAMLKLCEIASSGQLKLAYDFAAGEHPAIWFLTAARNACNDASSAIFGMKHAGIADDYRRLGTIARDIEAVRDSLDGYINRGEQPPAKQTVATKRKRARKVS